jgi:site-specific recombinase XerD
MTTLRQRMLEDLKLRGYSERTCEAYVAAVRQLAKHYRRSPDQLTEADLRGYFLHLTQVKKFARASVTIALCGIKFFFEQTLGQEWAVFGLARPPREAKLPVVLSQEEVRHVLGRVRIQVYRVCLTTIYACGLRLMEGARIQIPDIDGNRRMLHVHGKGNKDRYVPIPDAALKMLRDHWRTHRSSRWLFPAPTRHGLDHSLAHDGGPVTRSSLQSAFRRAVKKTGIRKRAHVHTLRHSYATHHLEAGVSLHLIQVYLGHLSPKTTAVYTHLTQKVRDTATDPINRLMDGLAT